MAVATTDNLAYYAKLIRDKALLRELIQAGTDIVCTAYETESTENAIDNAQQLVFQIAQQGMPDDLVHIKDILPVSWEQLEERHTNKGSLMGVSTTRLSPKRSRKPSLTLKAPP